MACSMWSISLSTNLATSPSKDFMANAMRNLCIALVAVLSCNSQASSGIETAEDQCLKYAKRLGSVYESDCRGQDFRFSGHSSVSNRPILMREFLPVQQPAVRVLVVGGIHGDELSSVSIVFNWMRELNTHSDQAYHWRLTPSMNPDGLFQRRAQRTNANGVDLNRNFPTPNWESESEHYWIHRTKRNPRRYPGPAPLSEPESRWLYEEILQFQPDVIVAVHAPFGIVDFDGPSTPPRRLGHLSLNLLGTYPGSLGNFAGVQQGIPVVTVELPAAGSMPTLPQQRKIWQDLVKWLDKHTQPKTQRAESRPVVSP